MSDYVTKTNVLSALARFKENTDALYETKADANDMKSEINQHDARLQNLEQKAGDYSIVQYRGTNAVPTWKAKYGLVDKIVGKSRSWNQLAKYVSGVRLSQDSDGVFTFINGSGPIWGESFSEGFVDSFGILKNPSHKYLVAYTYVSGTIGSSKAFFGNGYNLTPSFELDNSSHARIITSNIWYPFISSSSVTDYTDLKFYLVIRDLTLIFGSGNEPSTVADALAQLPALGQYNAYDAGSLVDTEVSGAKSVGVNIWDEETEIIGTTLYSKNYCPVTPSSTLYFLIPTGWLTVTEYDADKNQIGSPYSIVNNSHQISNNCCYIKFVFSSAYGTPYNHDTQICLNSASDKTTYHPYMTDTLSLSTPVTLRSAGSVADTDELNVEVVVDGQKVNKRRQTTRVGTKNLDDIQWSYLDAYGVYQGVLVGAKFVRGTSWGTSNAPYANAGYVGSADMSEGQYQVLNDGTIWIKDSNFESVRASYYLNYALATESVTLLDPIPDNSIYTEGGGTIDTIQEQTPVIDNCLDVGYLAV